MQQLAFVHTCSFAPVYGMTLNPVCSDKARA